MQEDSRKFPQEWQFLQGGDRFAVHCMVYYRIPHAEIPNVILFPAYRYRGRVRCHYFSVQQGNLQVPNAFFGCFRQFPAEGIYAPFRKAQRTSSCRSQECRDPDV